MGESPSPPRETSHSDTINQIASKTIPTDQEDFSQSVPLMIRCIHGTDSIENLHGKTKTQEAAIHIFLDPSNDESNIFPVDSCELVHVPRRGHRSVSNPQDEGFASNAEVIATEHIDGSRTVNAKPWSLLAALAEFFIELLSDFREI